MSHPLFTRREIPPEALDAAVRRLKAGRPLADVAKDFGVTPSTLQARLAESEQHKHVRWAKPRWKRPASPDAAAPAQRKPRRLRAKPPEAMTPAAIAARISEAVDRQLEAVEGILASLAPAELAEAERGARTLAALARTLTELSKIKTGGDATEPANDEHAAPRTLDELRDALLERLEQAVANRAGAVPDEPAAGAA
jgi:hypothetical protein